MSRKPAEDKRKKSFIHPWAAAGAVVLPAAALLAPYLIPVRPLKDTFPPEALADPDSHFVELNGLKIHVKTKGKGEPVFVLLHGFMASLYSWQSVMEPLSHLGRVIAYDRTAFGLSERPLTWTGQNPYSPETTLETLHALLDHFEVKQAILVGNSAGGTTAMQYALKHPERVSALIMVDAAIYTGGGAPGWMRPILATPQMRRIGPLLIRQIPRGGVRMLEIAWHKLSNLDPKMLDLYRKPMTVDNWDQALWEYTVVYKAPKLSECLEHLTLPVLVVSGVNDRIVPTADSIRLSQELPNASLALIPNAGHIPHEEQPEVFMDTVKKFISSLPSK